MARRIRKLEAAQPRRRIIGIDIGLECGYAIVDVGDYQKPRLVASGTWSFGDARCMGGGMLFEKFRQHIGTLIRQCKPYAMAYEVVLFRHRSGAAANVYHGMESQLTAMCEKHQIPFEGFGPGTIKKVATGHGNASKEMMIEVMGKFFDNEPTSDDDADARGAALTLARNMGWDDAPLGDR